jgi:tetratricopeptide (TPR) repeat protein
MAILFLLYVSCVLPAAAGERRQREVDQLSLAALLIRDGHYERADIALAAVDTTAKDTDLVRYHTLRGLVDLYLERYPGAVRAFNRALELGQEMSIVHVYLAQAHYRMESWRETITALDRAGDDGRNRPELWFMRFQCHWKLDEKRAAWQALSAGEERFPDQHDFRKRKIFFLIDLGLYQAAAELGRQYLRDSEPGLEDCIAIGSALRRSGRPREAAAFLESTVLKFPASRDARLELAHAYLDQEMELVAAHLFEEAALYDPALKLEAAEVYRRAKQYYQALYLNLQVVDQREKIRQRLAILLELKQYAKVLAMESALRRVRLLEDDHVRYAFAFAHFRLGDFAAAEGYLRQLREAEAFEKAARIRRAMEACREAKWECY